MSNNKNDLSSESQLSENKDKVKNAAQILADDWKWLMESERGRRIAWKLLGDCHVFESSFHQNLSQTNFNEGERNVGLKVLNYIMEHAQDKYVKMMQENNKKS